MQTGNYVFDDKFVDDECSNAALIYNDENENGDDINPNANEQWINYFHKIVHM